MSLTMTTSSNICSCEVKAIIQRILDNITLNIVIMDTNGTAIFINRSCQEFGKAKNLAYDSSCIGSNYLDVCERSAGMASNKCKEISQGIQDIATGKRKRFLIDYSDNHCNEIKWWLLAIYPFQCCKSNRLILSHLEITRIKKFEDDLLMREKELEKSNAVLNGLVNKYYQYHSDIEQQLEQSMLDMSSSVTHKPELVGNSSRHFDQKKIDAISALQSCASMPLTSQEITIASHVLEGKSSKDIARILHVSAETVNFHRKNIRKKLNLQGKKINLRSTLLNLCKSQ